MVFACLYPSMFNSRVRKRKGFFATGMQWLITLLQGEIITGTTTAGSAGDFPMPGNYRQLVAADKPGLVLDIAALRKTIWHFIALMSPELDIMATCCLVITRIV